MTNNALARPVHVVVSPFKTGTSSVGQALIDLGVGHVDMPYDGKLLRSIRKKIRKSNSLAEEAKDFVAFRKKYEDLIRSEFGDLVSAISSYNVFHDAPFGHTHLHLFVRKVLAPKAHFIWINRDFDSWLASVRNWQLTHPDVYPQHKRWLENPEEEVVRRRIFWNKHYQTFQLMRRFCPDDCFEMAWSDLKGYSALADYYQVAIPSKAFPRTNVSLP